MLRSHGRSSKSEVNKRSQSRPAPVLTQVVSVFRSDYYFGVSSTEAVAVRHNEEGILRADKLVDSYNAKSLQVGLHHPPPTHLSETFEVRSRFYSCTVINSLRLVIQEVHIMVFIVMLTFVVEAIILTLAGFQGAFSQLRCISSHYITSSCCSDAAFPLLGREERGNKKFVL